MTITDAIAVYGRLHPLLLHVPIGVLAGAALLQFVSLLRPQLGLRPAIGLLLWLAALVAVVTATSGWILAREEGYGGDTLELHRWIGIALTAATVVTAVLRARAGRSMLSGAAYGCVFLATLVLLVPAGHLGGTLTHGEGFITAPLFGPTDVAAIAAEPRPARTVFDRTVRPTLEQTCTSCHGAKKRKGGLSLENEDAILAGSRNGDVIVPGDAAASEIVRRMRLPIDDEDHMPPEGKRQPSEPEIAAIEAWIASGASFTDEGNGATNPAATPLAGPNAGAGANGAVASTIPARPASDELLDALRAALVHVEPVGPDSPLLWIDFAAPASAGKADDAFVTALLRPLVAYVDELSLGGSSVSDATLELVATMPNLRRLDLRGTAVTDAGIAALRNHRTLAEVSLVRTRVGDASVDALVAMPGLRRAFLWSSAITPRGLQRLRDGRRDLLADAGDAPESTPVEAEPPVKLGAAPKPAEPTAAAPATTVSLKPINTVCPVSGAPIDPKYTILYDGKVIGFCCPNCPKKFWEDPEAYLAKIK
ncbi:MAG: c-type cytochrome domain-containing protein [Phycisphaerales bacterium]